MFTTDPRRLWVRLRHWWKWTPLRHVHVEVQEIRPSAITRGDREHEDRSRVLRVSRRRTHL